VEKFLSENPPRGLSSFLVALSAALAVLAGHVETLLHVLVIVFVYLLWRASSSGLSWGQCARRLARFFLFSALGLGMAAVQFIPFLEYMYSSAAHATRAAYGVNPHYVPLPAAILNLIPDFYGNPIHGNYFAPFANYCMTVIGFAGVTSVFLALLSLFSPSPRKKFIWFYLCLGAASFCIVYKVAPIYQLVVSLPFLDIADNSRLLFCLGFSICVQASFFIHSLTENGPRSPRTAVVLAVAIFILAAAAVLAVCSKAFFEAHQFQFRFRHNLEPTLLFLAFLAATSFILLICRRNPLTGRRAALYLGLLMFVQTGVHAIGFNPAIPEGRFFPTPPALRFLLSDRSLHRCLFMGNVFFPNLSAWYGIQEARNYDAMGIKSYRDFQSAMGNFQNLFQVVTSFDEDLAGFLNVKYLMCERGYNPRLSMQVRYPERYRRVFADSSVRIYENLAHMPRAFLVPKLRFIGSGDELLKELPKLDYRNEALVSDPNAPSLKSGDLSHSSCVVTRYRPREAALKIHAEHPCYLVMSDNYFPGWRAFVDGRAQPIYRANGSFRLVPVRAAGDHNIRFCYSPFSFKIGAVISLISLLAAVIMGARPVRH
ncbi:MAG: YfhO family protein, partial [bacterium]